MRENIQPRVYNYSDVIQVSSKIWSKTFNQQSWVSENAKQIRLISKIFKFLIYSENFLIPGSINAMLYDRFIAPVLRFIHSYAVWRKDL